MVSDEAEATRVFRTAALRGVGDAFAALHGAEGTAAIALAEKRVRILTSLFAIIEKARAHDDPGIPLITAEQDAENRAELRRHVLSVRRRIAEAAGRDRRTDGDGRGEPGAVGVAADGADRPDGAAR